jgi:hypothetical protein
LKRLDLLTGAAKEVIQLRHPKVAKPVTISGKPGDDAKRYQIRAVQLAVEESKK